MKRLGDVAEIVMGQSPPGETVVDWNGGHNSRNGLPFIQGNAEFGVKSPSPLKWCVQPIKVAHPDDLLISVRAPVGEMNRAHEVLAIGRGLAAIRFTNTSQAFGWHIVNHAKGTLERVTQGSTFQAVGGETLRSLAILLPPLPEQRAIAAVLESIDEAIERTEAVVAATERLRDALLHELLTRGVPGWHTEWEHAPGIGTIPASWNVKRLGDVLANGPTNGIYKPESEYGAGTWLIRIDDFMPGELTRLEEFERIRVSQEEIQRYAVTKGDVLINRVNSLSHIGKSVLMPDLAEPTLFESNMMRLRLCPEVEPGFAMILLLSEYARRYFISRAKKAVQQASINQQDVTSLPIPLPGKLERTAILEVSIALNGRILRDIAALKRLKALKKSASDALLTGRVRVDPPRLERSGA